MGQKSPTQYCKEDVQSMLGSIAYQLPGSLSSLLSTSRIVSSPSILKSTKSSSTPGKFRWSIDHLALINPVEIDSEDIRQQAMYLNHLKKMMLCGLLYHKKTLRNLRRQQFSLPPTIRTKQCRVFTAMKIQTQRHAV
uniref:Protein aurora borealis n=1 Tax=Meleagris gallopavo TaxID=9103 RepID=A0A803YKH1_MELGA